MLTIGQLAARLRVTPRTLRHYEAIGLLRPTDVDPRTGYRSYGPAALADALLIEQLKPTGLALATIAEVVHGARSLDDALASRRAELRDLEAEQHRQRQAIDRLGAARAAPTAAEIVTLPAFTGCIEAERADAGALAAAVRRTIQRMRRRLLAEGVRPAAFSAVFPLDLDDDVPFTVRAHVAGAARRGPPARAVRTVLSGPLELLPLAYEVALAAVDGRGLTPSGTVVEQYLEMGPCPVTEVAVLVE